jgi:hypothetical protein
MGDRQGGDWMRALGEVQEAIRGCLAALDRYEARFAELLSGTAPTPRPSPPSGGWDDRLAAAQTEADEVERLLAEQEAVWGRWQGAFAAWRRSLEQTP